MHIMGGFGVASLTGAILSYRGEKVSYMKLFFIYFVVACMWEVYEHVMNVIHTGVWYGLRTTMSDGLDTVKDLFDGFVGMSIAYLFVKK